MSKTSAPVSSTTASSLSATPSFHRYRNTMACPPPITLNASLRLARRQRVARFVMTSKTEVVTMNALIGDFLQDLEQADSSNKDHHYSQQRDDETNNLGSTTSRSEQ